MLLALYFLVFAAAFLVTWVWLKLARALHWFDHPNQRSSHTVPTPKSGGAGFVVAFTLYIGLLYGTQAFVSPTAQVLLLGILLALVGFVDDLRNLGIRTRIVAQVVTTCIGIALLDNLPSLQFPWGGIDSPWLLYPLLILALVWLINLYNFMDGIDGLAALEAVFFCLAVAVLAGKAGRAEIALLALGLAFSVCGFLYFNLPPARVFMGDLGSNYLGYALGMLGIVAARENALNLWTVLILLSVFIVDATTTLIGRMRAGLVWYHAHRSHAYQVAALRHASHGKVIGAVLLINLLWLLPLGWLTTDWEEAGLFITLLAWLPLFFLARSYKDF